MLKNGQSFTLEGATWTVFSDKASKSLYYYNNRTGVSQWEDPRVAAKARGKSATAAKVQTAAVAALAQIGRTVAFYCPWTPAPVSGYGHGL